MPTILLSVSPLLSISPLTDSQISSIESLPQMTMLTFKYQTPQNRSIGFQVTPAKKTFENNKNSEKMSNHEFISTYRKILEVSQKQVGGVGRLSYVYPPYFSLPPPSTI